MKTNIKYYDTTGEVAGGMKPMLCNTQVAQNIINGSQTQDRRLINPQPYGEFVEYQNTLGYSASEGFLWAGFGNPDDPAFYKPKYQVGDVLYVREAWWDLGWMEQGKWNGRRESHTVGPRYVASCPDPYAVSISGAVQPTKIKWQDTSVGNSTWRKRPSIHMPKWAARIFLKIKRVRVERIQDISIEDILAEGVDFGLLESMLNNSWGRLPIKDGYWFNGDEDCGDYCYSCGKKAASEANKHLEANDRECILEGYERITSDGVCCCIACDVHLDYWLTQYGLESELSHFEDYLTPPYGRSDKYALFCVFESAIHSHGLNIDEWNDTDEKKDLAERLYKLAWRVFWESIYPGSWERNDFIFVYDFEKCGIRR